MDCQIVDNFVKTSAVLFVGVSTPRKCNMACLIGVFQFPEHIIFLLIIENET